MLAAVFSGIPTIAFEPNVVPGFANKVVGMMVSAAAVQFEQTCRYFNNCRVTGVPVRREFFEKTAAMAKATCATQCPANLLVFGGSQGAHAINQVVLESLEALKREVPKLHIVHQLGEWDYEPAQACYLHAEIRAELHPFINHMPEAFRKADLLLCRSGASTVAEIMAAGKPAILVPFPAAADDHQTRNAEVLVATGAAVLIKESELTAQRLVETVRELLNNRVRLAEMGEAARRLAHANAAAEIAGMAAKVAGVAPVNRPVEFEIGKGTASAAP